MELSTTRRVLIIEDDKGLNKLLTKVLSRAGFATKGVLTGKDAIDEVRADPERILVIDQQLPDMTGTDIVHTLIEQGFQPVFVVITGHGDEKIAVEMMKLGARDYLLKDIDVTDLLPKVLERICQEQENAQRLVLAEKAVAKSEEKYKILFDSIYDAILIFPIKDLTPLQFVQVNEVACTQLGYSREELLTMTSVDIKADKGTPDISILSEIIAKGHAVFEAEHRRKNGQLFPVEISSQMFKSDGTHYILSLVRDITERRKIEAELRQAKKMESIGILAGGIAHDFNNLLTPIVGLAEILSDDLLSDSSEYKNVQEILKAGKRGRQIVKQILAFSRQNKRTFSAVQPQHLLTEVLELIQSTIPKNIEIEQQIPEHCGSIMADPSQLHQIAMNLITNAFHAVERTKGKITVQLEETTLENIDSENSTLKPGRYVLLTVSDTGVGIDPTNLATIFEPYYTTKETDKGTGLGLAVVYGIVKTHRGEIRVSSELEKGTTFSVYLPVIEESKAQAFIEKTTTEPKRGNEHVLLVDDEESIVIMSKRMLERLGYKVQDHTCCLKALTAFKADPTGFDFVITDRSMPNMTGEQLAKEITSIRSDIPIILCTGFSDKTCEETMAEAGIRAVLTKPFVRAELARVIQDVL